MRHSTALPHEALPEVLMAAAELTDSDRVAANANVDVQFVGISPDGFHATDPSPACGP